jgi:membrane protein YqaA with SNARE-associated domain
MIVYARGNPQKYSRAQGLTASTMAAPGHKATFALQNAKSAARAWCARYAALSVPTLALTGMSAHPCVCSGHTAPSIKSAFAVAIWGVKRTCRFAHCTCLLSGAKRT